MTLNQRQFLEGIFHAYTSGNLDKFYSFFDSKAKWVIHGDNHLAGIATGIQEIKEGYKKLFGSFKEKPKHHIRYMVVEGKYTAVFLMDECKGKDGKPFYIDYSLLIELSDDGKKIVKVDNFVDSLQMKNIFGSPQSFRKSA